MRRPVLFSLAVLLSSCTHGSGDDAQGVASDLSSERDRRIVTLQLHDWSAEMRWLQQGGYDIAGVSLPDQRADVIVTARERGTLDARGLSIVAERPAAEAPLTAPDAAASYQTPASTEAKLKAYAASHPKITHLTSIGKSREGRDVWALEIARDPSHHSPGKPAVLFNGSHHARELMTPEVALDTIDHLLANDGKDAKVTHWIDANEIWVVPMLNVDGNNRVWTDDAFWRKNASGCKVGAKCASGTGVDLNRNYNYKWAACDGSSTDPFADDYHGPSAGSEPETKALEALVSKIRPVFDISYHSYSELVLYPGGCEGAHATERAAFEQLGSRMAAVLPLDEGKGTYTPGTPWELLYAVDGDDIDWMYSTYGAYAFAIELNSGNQGFQPPYAAWRDKTVKKLRPAWELLLDALDGSGVRGVLGGSHAGANAQMTPKSSGTTDATDATDAAAAVTHPVAADGSFHFVVAPGAYHLHVTAAGHAPYDKDVTVGATRVNLSVPW